LRRKAKCRIKYARINAQIDNSRQDGILEEFRVEFMNCWGQLPNKLFFLFLLAVWLGLFQFLGNSTFGFVKSPSLLKWMYLAYKPSDMGDDGQGNLIPFVVLGLFWWKRKELLALTLRTWSAGLLIICAGLVLHLLGYVIQQPRVSIIGLFVGIYGLTGLAWGPEWLKASFFPFILFAFCVPLGTLQQPITFPLRLLVCQIVEGISHVFSIDVLREGTILKDPTGRYQYEVAAACSGVRSLIATIAMAVIYGMLSFKSWWRRGALFASAIPLAVIGNVVRMLTIVVAAEIGGQEVGNKVHEGGPGGIISLLPYVPAFIGLLALAHWLEERKTEPEPSLQTQPA
jgi:exosortase